MATAIPAIACLGVIGRNNNPLHITILPTARDAQTNAPVPIRPPLQFSLLLSSTVDVFESRVRQAAASGTLLSGDFGLLHAIDERLAAYGHETNTGVKFVIVVDMRGRERNTATPATAGGGKGNLPGAPGVGLRESELKVVFRAMQTAYVGLLQNPFYNPDEHVGGKGGGVSAGGGAGGKKITSKKFADEMRRIGEVWMPGGTNLS